MSPTSLPSQPVNAASPPPSLPPLLSPPQVVSAAASSLVSHLSVSCWEEAALLARTWNLHTALMDSGLTAARGEAEEMRAENTALRERVRAGEGAGEGAEGGRGASSRW